MKLVLFMLAFVMVSSSFAENQVNWWERSVKTADETLGISDSYFSPREKGILQEFLRSQSEEYGDLDDFSESDHKDKKFKKDKKVKKQKKLPKGLEKKLARGGELPPGWQKKIARGEVMDSEIYESSLDLPQGILNQLEIIDGTSVRQVEDHIVRVRDASGLILDVLTQN
jgi:hypothetical protein